jgi:hypothetical protein
MLTEERLATPEPHQERPSAPAAPNKRNLIPAGLALLAATSGVAALAVSYGVFPDMSDNNDEAVYRLQADALRSGHLFPPAPPEAEAARPWLSYISDGHYVSKYTPAFPALIAFARIVFGTDQATLFIVAAATVLSAFWLAAEVLPSRRQALLAAAILAASPAILIESGMFLSYLFVVALIRGVRSGSARLLGLAGLLGGVAVFARPFDALLVAVPFAGWWALTRRGSWPAAKRDLRWIAAGAALPLMAMFGYFWAATGNPLHPPFDLLHPDDKLGFGSRQMYEGQIPTDFTPVRGLIGAAKHLQLAAFWGFGGFVLVGLALAGVRKLRGAGLAVACVALSVPAGYVFFWGIWGSTVWGGPRRFGPFYTLAIFTALAIVGARGLSRMWAWDRFLAGSAVVGMTLVSTFVFQMAVADNRPFREERDRLYQPLRDLPEGRSVIFLPALQQDWLAQPFALARNGSLDGPVVWALDFGAEANRKFLRAFPDRAAYRLVATQMDKLPLNDEGPDMHFTTRLEPFPRARRQYAPP